MSDYVLKVPHHRAMPAFDAARWWGQPRFKGILHYKSIHTFISGGGSSFGYLYLPACLLPWNTPNVRRRGYE